MLLACLRGMRSNGPGTDKEATMCYREDWYEWEAMRKARQRRAEQQKAEASKPAAPSGRPQAEPETRKPKEVETEPELV